MQENIKLTISVDLKCCKRNASPLWWPLILTCVQDFSCSLSFLVRKSCYTGIACTIALRTQVKLSETSVVHDLTATSLANRHYKFSPKLPHITCSSILKLILKLYLLRLVKALNAKVHFKDRRPFQGLLAVPQSR